MTRPNPLSDSRASRRQRNAPTINDVAREAGVSPMTVSRVINGEKAVRPATRAKVDVAIAALNYAPSAAARSLAGGEEMRIGLLYSNPSSSYLSEFLVGSLEQASGSGVHLVVEKWDEQTSIKAVIDHLLRGRIDGVILPPPLCDLQDMAHALVAANIPAVAVATGRSDGELAAVRIDDRQAAYEMTRHLVSLGHSRIGFIKGHPNQSASIRRLEGYVDALDEAGIAVQNDYIAQGYFTYRSGLDAAEHILALPDAPTAIFASNDDMAAATVAIAHRGGLDVPGDLTVCGFDDTSLATTIWPELTTIRQPISAMSRAAVELLVKMLRARRAQDEDMPAHLVLDHTLIRRQSDAPPRVRPRVVGR
ncbi:MAG: LacI family DNA-binding transcriptional regulator [Sphingobium sp.]|uniref:LacI family DNA-binding transcriptional regulator n=1 Tax=Sphingobium sp. TaxID=1912891 RepID=UPI000C5B4549|nr:LacI family DNA-binding transcriptional regulator [Sphingobium sp.]MBU0659637.1 LacI family DNA-binding transcriptional regulator [Alphaproteobacteria bacterium]MBA4755598.1 LacI family DNA-binding transcriptional regulator [Sphingobium sp.]MBS87553.1 LacI family transcriptional regulator [Sphingobium sp.]MBU1259124.1 LacI family DNA-binding transcriptional regulator [Alphaproteobacteria bacterium]MBU1463798.1 LacI family DNA-binding transcriptional regulator [Alphaproteobacteria bacterium]